MKKLSFNEKNDFVLRHKSVKYFSVDLDLFRRQFFTHRLNNDLSRANVHTFDRLDGQMLYALLDVIPPEEILANRTGIPLVPEEKKDGPAPPNPEPPDVEPPASKASDPEPPAPATPGPQAQNSEPPVPATPGSQAQNSEPPVPAPSDSVAKEIETLRARIDELRESGELTREEIEDVRGALDDGSASIEALQASFEALQKKTFRKKKASGKSSPT